MDVEMLIIRRMKPGEEASLVAIFREAVRRINRHDYSAEQIDAWAPYDLDIAAACQRIQCNQPFVAEYEGQVCAYADLQPDGYIDQFFCHPDYLGRGIATQLFSHLKRVADERGITTLYANVSKTARPFFERIGFSVLEEQRVELRGQVLTNYRMVADFAKGGSVD